MGDNAKKNCAHRPPEPPLVDGGGALQYPRVCVLSTRDFGCVRGQVHVFSSSKELRLTDPGPRVKAVLGQFEHAVFIFLADVHFSRFGRFSGAERAHRRARARNRAKL